MNIGQSVALGATPQPVSAPSAPRNLVATPGKRSITLTWAVPLSNGGSPITGYEVLRGTTSGGPKTPVATLGIVTTYKNTGLTSGTTYFYEVRAVNVVGTGAASNEASAVAR